MDIIMCYSVDILETELLQKYGIYCRCLYDFFSFLLVGVVQLLNKLDATSFNKNDENLFEVIFVLQSVCYFMFMASTQV